MLHLRSPENFSSKTLRPPVRLLRTYWKPNVLKKQGTLSETNYYMLII